MKTRLELNKKFLDKNLEGRINLEGLARFAYLPKGEKGRPELVLIYEKFPGYKKYGLSEIIAMAAEGKLAQICYLMPDEKRFRFKKTDVVITTVKADNEYVEDHKELLDEGEAFCWYRD